MTLGVIGKPLIAHVVTRTTSATGATRPWRPTTEPGRNSHGEIIRRRHRAHVDERATVATPGPGGRVT